MTVAEKDTLVAQELTGVRLSCQLLCNEDIAVRVVSRLEGSGREDAGARPADQLQPEPVQWTTR